MNEPNRASPEDLQPAEPVDTDVARDDPGESSFDAPVSQTEGQQSGSLSIGAELRQAREAAGLTLAEIAERTKIRPGILTDLEEDAHDRLPALTYTLGFIKAYARSVQLDPVEAAERYRQQSQKADPIPTIVDLQPLEAKRLPSGRLVAGATVAVLLLLGGFWLWGSGLFEPANPMLEASAPSAVNSADAEVEDTALAATEAEAPTPVGGAVTIAANDEVWLRIADGNEVFFTGILKAGETLELPDGRAWKLRTGRAGALGVKVGGQSLPPLGGPAQQVRDLSLQPADLLAASRANG